jgi:ABC-type dipeptide/oligopeptide/nickel transport system ATPase subunit
MSEVAMNECVLQARGLSKAYGSGDAAVHVLSGVSLTVGKGETLSIIGASGSGKSTSWAGWIPPAPARWSCWAVR